MGRWTVYLWQRAAILAAAIVVAWITGSFRLGVAVAVGLFFGLVGALFAARLWREGRERRKR